MALSLARSNTTNCPGQISVSYDGIDGLWIDDDGALHVGTELGELVDDAPYIYQTVDGQEKAVAGQFALVDDDTYTFEITGAYDPNLELVVDPDLAWSSYLGGSEGESGHGIAVEGSGNALVTGGTDSSDWVSRGWDTSYNGGADGFVAKITLADLFPADFDTDGDVDGDDFLAWQGGFGTPSGANLEDGDADADGDVDGDDFLIWQQNFASGSGSGSVATLFEQVRSKRERTVDRVFDGLAKRSKIAREAIADAGEPLDELVADKLRTRFASAVLFPK